MDQVADLLFDARNGDRDAFAACVQVLEPPVRLFLALWADVDDLDDLVQETFLRAWRSLHRYRGEANARTWVLAIAHCAAVDATRAGIRHRRRVDAVETLSTLSYANEPEYHALLGLVAGLDDDRREAFVLTQVVGLSYEEAATVMGVAVGTIRSRVARARADLISHLHESAVG